MASANISMLQTVANGLGTLKDDMVFIGGAVAELYPIFLLNLYTCDKFFNRFI